MDKDQMVEGVMRSAGISKANVYRFYDGLVELAKKQLLRVRVQKAREARNPRTGEKVHVARKKVVRFKAYKDLKETLNPANKSADTAESETPDITPSE
ncbi:MAG: HU family DNA-binding protein [Deltaproteobacteria bacterium]|nr:HU family DNA-binding protein [Deltaproteobacteria bacterium]